MAKDLRFDVSALDKASQTFARMGAAVERFEKRLDRLDGKKVEVEATVKTDQAEREVGRFATDTRRKLIAALANLPELEIDGNSSPLDRKLADVRRRMAELADKTVGVDLSAEEAIAEARVLQRELDELARTSPDIQVRTDAAAASLELAKINAEADKLDGKRVELKIDVDKSISETLIQVAQLGRALGALALPAGIVAAVPQIAALGAAALTTAGSVGLLPAVAGAAGLAVGTLGVAFSGVADALGETDTPAKLKKVNEALAGLSPAARSTVEEIRALTPAWTALGDAVQESMFDGVSAQVRELGGQYIPILSDAMVNLTEDLNYSGIQLAAFFRQSATADLLKQALQDSGDAVSNLADTLTPLASVFVDTFAVGASVLADITSGAGAATQQFAAFVRNARESGELRAWIEGGVTAIGRLISITGNLGSIFSSVFEAGEIASGNFLENVDRVTQQIADFFNTERGQDILAQAFRDINDTVSALLPGLRDLGLAVFFALDQLAAAGVFTGFATALSSIMSAAAPLLAVLGALASVVLPPLLAVVSALAPVLVPLAAGLLAIRAASSGMNRLRDFATSTGEARRQVVGALSPMRSLSGEMRVQSALARQAGEAHARLSGGLAAMAQSQNTAIAAAGRLGAEMQSSYRTASTAVQGFATTAGTAAERATVALGERMASGVSRGVESVISGVSRTATALRQLPSAAASAASTLRTGIGVAAITAGERLRDFGRQATNTAATIRTGIGVAAIDAAQKLRELPAAASSAASTLRTGIGVAAIDAGQRLRQLGTSAAETGRSLATGLQAGVTSAVTAVRQLPSAAAEAGRSLATGLRNGVQEATAVARLLPTAIGQSARETAASVATGMRAIPDGVRNAMSSVGAAVSTGIGHLGRLAGAASGAGTAIGSGLVRAGGSLVSFLGGPWGVALAIAGVALSLFGQKQAEAAAKAQEHQAALDALNGTLDTYSGAITQATVNEKAKQLQQDGSLDTLRRLGVATGDYTQASLGNEEALGRVTKQLGDQTRAGIENSNAYRTNREQLDAMGLTLDDLTLAAMGFAPAQDKVNSAIERSSSAGPEALASNRMLADSLMKAGGDAAVMAQKLGVSVDEVRKMQEATRSAATASQDFQNSLRGMTPALAGIKDGVAPTTALANGLRDLSGSAGLAAQNAGQAAEKLGGVDAGARAARDSMVASRKAFVDAATGALGSATAAEDLANKIGLIPAAAETNFRTNATGVAAEMNTLSAQIRAIPPGKDVQVQALTEPARANLTAMGFQVQNLPDGTFKITANTEAARANLDAFTRGAADRKAEVQIGANKAPADQSLAAVLRAIQSGKGEVLINGNAVPAQQALSFVMGAIGQAKGDVRIGAQSAPAQQVLQAYLAAVNAGSGIVDINGNKVPADQVLAALVGQVGATTATMPLDAAPAPAEQKIAATVSRADGSTGTITIAGRNDPANASTSAAVRFADGSTGTIIVAGNPTPANGTISATVRYANGSTGTVTVRANDSAARAAISALQRTTYSSHIVNVYTKGGGGRGYVGGPNGGTRLNAAGALLKPMAEGGVLGFADGAVAGGRRLTPMAGGRAEMVPPDTWRVIGDNMRSTELYAPLDGSDRTRQLLAEGARHEGYRLVDARSMIAMADGGMVSAARAILGRMNARQQMFEDWTWRGAPAVVGQYNDQLLNARDRAGMRADGRRFLEDYIRRNTAVAPRPAPAPSAAAMRAQVQAVQAAKAATPAIAVKTGLDIAELRAIHAQLVGLRGDLTTSAGWGPEMVEQLRGLSDRLLRDFSATARAAVGRDISEFKGSW